MYFCKINLKIMKYIFVLLTSLALVSCAVKVPYTKEIKEQSSIDTDAEMRRLQFFTSGTIILDQVLTSDREMKTDENGVLVDGSTKVKERIIIPTNTKCVFDEFGERDKIMVRFEEGKGKTLTFDIKPNGKRYYLDVNTNEPGGPIVKYGKNTYKLDMVRSSGTSVYLLIKKNTKQARSKGRVLPGMKV